jgi:hypothetical protein
MPRGAEECYGVSVPMGIVLEEEAGLLSALESTRVRVFSHADVVVRVLEVLDG